jgi:hypothetical protein
MRKRFCLVAVAISFIACGGDTTGGTGNDRWVQPGGSGSRWVQGGAANDAGPDSGRADGGIN